jgi:hypothetical protein
MSILEPTTFAGNAAEQGQLNSIRRFHQGGARLRAHDD